MGLEFGLGAILGGILYTGLGARLCFGVSAILPSLSLLLLALTTARPLFLNSMGLGGAWVSKRPQCSRGDRCAYEPNAGTHADARY